MAEAGKNLKALPRVVVAEEVNTNRMELRLAAAAEVNNNLVAELQPAE